MRRSVARRSAVRPAHPLPSHRACEAVVAACSLSHCCTQRGVGGVYSGHQNMMTPEERKQSKEQEGQEGQE